MFFIFIFSLESQSPEPLEYSEMDPYPFEDYVAFDPDYDQRSFSHTPPPACVDPAYGHQVCIPPVWGERVTGPPLLEDCVLCQQAMMHLAVRCVRCHQTPACCSCLWMYLRSRYNSGCPCCRFGDPGEGNNPLVGRSNIARYGTGRGVVTGVGRGGVPAILMGRGRSRGRGRGRASTRLFED